MKSGIHVPDYVNNWDIALELWMLKRGSGSLWLLMFNMVWPCNLRQFKNGRPLRKTEAIEMNIRRHWLLWHFAQSIAWTWISFPEDSSPSSLEARKFLDEALRMREFDHQHILGLIGISLDQEDMPLVVLPFMKHGDLLSYLRCEDNVRIQGNINLNSNFISKLIPDLAADH